jgi:hypothetical protein
MDWPFMTFQRVGWLQSKTFNFIVLGVSVGVLLLTLIFWPVTALIRRHYAYRLNLSTREKRLRLAVRLVCAADLIFLAALVILLSSLEAPGAINSHLDIWLHLLQVVGWIGALGTIVVIYNAVYSWRVTKYEPKMVVAAGFAPVGEIEVPERHLRRSAPLRALLQTMIALACIGFSWFLIYWNLLNLSSNY